MDLPSFNVLWETSEKLSELETVLDELDRSACNVVVGQPLTFHYLQQDNKKKKKRRRRGGLYGTVFDVEDQAYYEPLKYCCDDAFYTEQELARHVQLHLEVHAGDNYEDIYRDGSDKAVLKWRQARKINFPTLERIMAKKEAHAKKIKRGEIFETRQFGALHRKKSILLGTVKSTEKSAARATQSAPTPSDCCTEELVNSTACLVPLDYGSDHGVDDGGDKEIETPDGGGPENQRRNRRRRGGKRRTERRQRLAGLSSENLESVQPKDTVGEDMATGDQLDVETVICEEVENKVPVRPPPRAKNPFAAHPVVQMAAKRATCSRDGNRIYSRPTLLHMLLAPEIRRERNQLMQCLRYVIQHNFFLDSPDTPDADS